MDADLIYHQLLVENRELCDALVEVFGSHIQDGTGINRKALGTVVFGNPERLAQLNVITHSFITQEMNRRSELAEQEGKQAFVIDAIRLIESGLGERCSDIVAILAPLELRVQRIMARDGISEDYARARIAAQQPDSFYRQHASYVLENGGESPQAFAHRGLALFENLLYLSS